MNSIKWIIFIAITILAFSGLIFWSQANKVSVDVSEYDSYRAIVASDDNGNIADHIKGNKDAKIILVEYGDYQCPGCGGAHPIVSKIVDDYKEDILFIYRNYPLPGHTNARSAVAAAEAAGLQDKYWEMHDKLFTNQNDWANANAKNRTTVFKSYASSLGLDIDKFVKDMTSDEISKKIGFDLALGKKDNVTMTPSFYINGKALDKSVSSNSNLLREEIDKLLK